MTEITRLQEVADLPQGSVLVNEWGYFLIDDHGGLWCIDTGGWQAIDDPEIRLPMTLLHRPDLGSQEHLSDEVRRLAAARGRDAERELEVFVMLARFVDQHHWYDTNYCHPVPGEDCSPWCSACEVLRHVDDQVLREAREANGYV